MRNKEAAIEFARYIKSLGFKVYLAKSETYGFITTESGERVLSFSFSLDDSLSGNYYPPSSESGTGWRLTQLPSQLKTKADVDKALNASPDYQTGKGWKRFTTLKDYLAMYQSSSQFKEV